MQRKHGARKGRIMTRPVLPSGLYFRARAAWYVDFTYNADLSLEGFRPAGNGWWHPEVSIGPVN